MFSSAKLPDLRLGSGEGEGGGGGQLAKNGQGSGKWTVEDGLWVVDVEDFWIDCRGWVASDG